MERAQEYAVFYTEAELKAIQILIEAYINDQLPMAPAERIEDVMVGGSTNVSGKTRAALLDIEAERRMADYDYPPTTRSQFKGEF